MRISNDSIWIKILAVIRFRVFKLLLLGKLKSKGTSLIGRSCDIIIKSGKIEFNGRVVCSGFNQIYSKGQLTIGHNVYINEFSRIVAHDKITIGSNVTIAKFVTILDHDHKFSLSNNALELDGYETDAITIGDNVWIADKVTILKGATIGDNVVIAAHSVVKGDVESNTIVGGIPAKVIKRID